MTETSNIPAEPGFIEQFKTHPESVGETYWSHLAFAFRFAGQMFAVGFAALIHGLIPPLFCSTGSDFIRRKNTELTQRKP
ncbi:MAG: DUF6356 family protein [Pseudomonadota bacterium]